MKNKGKKVYVGLSGGVDSSVSAALLKQEGYDVTGVFIKVWHPDFLDCNWKAEMRDAMRVCAKLDIPFKKLDLEEEYKENVIDYMIEEYSKGRTPNPDVMCNKYVKFGSFFDFAIADGADFVATGHYAQIKKTGYKHSLVQAIDNTKDQTYFLWTLTSEHLSKTLFPIGGMEKSQVRKVAEKFNLFTSEKKDSQGLCFIGHVDIKEFLKRYIETKPGDVLNTEGKIVGTHEGAILYTIGQRHGFNLNQKSNSEKPLYIISKDTDSNTITVSEKEKTKDESLKYKIESLNIINKDLDLSSGIEAQIRYHGKKFAVKIEEDYVLFKTVPDYIASGQSVVFYKGNECLGGAIIA